MVLSRWYQRAAPAGPLRDALLRQLEEAIGGRPASDPAAARILGAEAAAAQGALRATRARRTSDAHSRALRRLRDLLVANPTFGAQPDAPSAAAWDVLCEGLVTTFVAPPVVAHGWSRPRGWPVEASPQLAGAVASAAATALDRLGYVPRRTLRRLDGALTALGCRDAEDVARVDMVFPWEVFAGALQCQPRNPWQTAALALVTLGVVRGGRPGASCSLLLRHLTRVPSDDGPPVVAVRMSGFRHKTQHARATQRGRRTAPELAYEHWALRRWLLPWVSWLREQGAAPGQFLFPSIVRDAHARVRTAAGWVAVGADGDRYRIEPARTWSSAQVAAALTYVLGGAAQRRGRTLQGLRSGANVELMKLGYAGTTPVSAVTRRVLQGRSLRETLQSEAAYFEAFEDDTRQASRQLGSLQIERCRPQAAAGHGADGADAGGQLRVVAVSRSAGAHRDWVRCDGPAADIPAAVAAAAADAAAAGEGGGAGGGGAGAGGGRAPHADDAESSQSSASSSDAASVGADGPPSRALVRGDRCARCGVSISCRDPAWMCDGDVRDGATGDVRPCDWGVCLMCHPGGARAALFCPEHAPS